MKNSILENLSAQVATIEGERNKLASLIASRSQARQKIEGEIDTATAAHNAANSGLNELLVQAAMGEVVDLEADRNAVEATAKAVSSASKGAGLVRELQAIEAGLNARMAPLDEMLTGLRTQLAHEVNEAKIATVEADLSESISAYTALAEKTMAALARAMACHQGLAATGRSPELLNQGFASTVFGTFTGSPLKGDGADMLRAERARIDAVLR